MNPVALSDTGLDNGGAIGNFYPYGVIESIANSELDPFLTLFLPGEYYADKPSGFNFDGEVMDTMKQN